MFHEIFPCSPVEQEFIWFAEYDDHSFLTEYNFDNKEENLFSSIEKDRLIRFGIVGKGKRFYFEVFGGTFKVDGKMYELHLESKDQLIALTGNQMNYNDIISYKKSEMYINPVTLQTIVDSTITDYVFGYKTNIDKDNFNLQFKSQCVMSYDNPMYMNLRLVSSKRFVGDLVIRKNGKEVDRIQTNLKKNVAHELNWIIQ